MPEEIIYTTECQTCDIHKTDLGTLKELEKTVLENFPSWSLDRQADLIINWFKKFWKTKLAKDEKIWKEEMARRIQKDKEKNIKTINKGE